MKGLGARANIALLSLEWVNLSKGGFCLRRGGLSTVGEVVNCEEKDLMALRNFGLKSRRELEERLSGLGLSLGSQSGEDEENHDAEGEESTDLTVDKVESDDE